MTANFIINTMLFLQRRERKGRFSLLKKSKNTYFKRYCAKNISFRDCHFKKCKILANFYLYYIDGKPSLILTIVKLGQRQEFCKMSPEALFCLLTFTCRETLLKAAHFKANETLICHDVEQYLLS